MFRWFATISPKMSRRLLDADDLKEVNDLVNVPRTYGDKVHLYTGREPIFDSYGLEDELPER